MSTRVSGTFQWSETRSISVRSEVFGAHGAVKNIRAVLEPDGNLAVIVRRAVLRRCEGVSGVRDVFRVR